MKDQEKLVTVREYSTNVEASMARDILENEGISCMLTNETFSGIYPIARADTPCHTKRRRDHSRRRIR